MAGYSKTPLWKKLGIKPGHRVGLSGAPADFESALSDLDGAARIVRRVRATCQVIVLFVTRETVLERKFATLRKHLDMTGGLWIAWPKKSSGVETDLSDGAVRAFGLAQGLVDNKVCAIDDTWSGLRFVVRVADRRS